MEISEIQKDDTVALQSTTIKSNTSASQLVIPRPVRHLDTITAVHKQKELEEEVYIEGVSQIVRSHPSNLKIKRDFFPLLASIEDAKDLSKKIDDSISLDTFQANYTSEDNAAFNLLIKNQNEEFERKHAWRYKNDKDDLLLDGPNLDVNGFQGPRNYLDSVGMISVNILSF